LGAVQQNKKYACLEAGEETISDTIG
jgi:hypothetical protein